MPDILDAAVLDVLGPVEWEHCGQQKRLAKSDGRWWMEGPPALLQPRTEHEARCIIRCALIAKLTAAGCRVAIVGGHTAIDKFSERDQMWLWITEAHVLDAALATAALSVLKGPPHG